MGLLRAVTGTVTGALVFIAVISIVVGGIAFLLMGPTLIAIITDVAITVIVPSLIMAGGLASIYFLGYRGNSGHWIIIGFVIFIAGFIMAVILGGLF